MIRGFNQNDIDEINLLLQQFDYQLSNDSFNNPFLNILVYYEESIKGIIIYDLIYDRCEIEYIAVDKRCRNNGIGSKLIQEIEKQKINNISLEVKEDNIIAIEFYKKNGFKIKAIRKNYYGNKNGYLMVKELGE